MLTPRRRRLALYLVIVLSIAAGLFTGRAMFFSVVYVSVILLIISWVWVWTSLRGLQIGRQTRSRRTEVGSTFVEKFIIGNRSIFPKLWIELEDKTTLPLHNIGHVVPPLGFRQQHQWQVQTPCLLRGEYQLGPMRLMSGDSFGLFYIERNIEGTERAIVYPASVEIDRFMIPAGALTGGEAQRQITQHVTTNAVGVRDYVSGDTINRIHWRTTARRGKLSVKEFEIDPMVDIWLFVDFSIQSTFRSPDYDAQYQQMLSERRPRLLPATEEYAASIGVSLLKHFVTQERSIGFTAYLPHREVYLPDRSNRQLVKVQEALAVARPQAQRTLTEMLQLETQTFSRGTSLIIVTASLDSQWVAQTQTLTSRGIRPMVVYIQPESFSAVQNSQSIRDQMIATRLPHIIVNRDENLTQALAQRPVI